MKEEVSGKILWNEAGKAGIVLGLIPIVYMGLSALIGGLSSENVIVAFMISVLKFLLWALKFGGCIWAMAFFMKKFAASYNNVDNRDTFRLGTATALLSALIVSAFSLALMLINPDQINEAFDLLLAQYSSMFDSNTMAAMENMRESMPTYSFIGNLIYCFVFGLILSAILSRSIPSRNPFDSTNDNEL